MADAELNITKGRSLQQGVEFAIGELITYGKKLAFSYIYEHVFEINQLFHSR